jgi:ketosteroid isomerase-like protein
MKPVEVITHAHELVRAYDIAFVECFAADGVLELPFAPPGVPRRLEGRVAIRRVLEPAYRAARTAGRRILAYRDQRVHETADPEVVVYEFTLAGADAHGASYGLPFIHTYRVRAGAIVEMRDYFDSLALSRRLVAPRPTPSPRAVFHQLIAAITEARWDDATECYADDAVVVHPMDPPGTPRLEGKEALRAHFDAARGLPFVMSPRDIVIHETADPEVIVAELDYLGRVTTTGRVFQLPHVFVMRIRDGKIVASRDYGNRYAFAHALGQLPELLARLERSD